MRSPFSLRNWLLFILINIVISAATAYIVVRMLIQAASRPDQAMLGVPAALQTPGIAPIAPAGTPGLPGDGAPVSAGNALATSPAVVTPPATAVAPQAQAPAPGGGTRSPAQAPAQATRAVQPSQAVTSTANVRISTIVFAGQRGREAVVIVNEGDQVDLTGWTLSTPRGQSYTFGNVLLFKDSFINLHTTKGVDVPTDLFWDQDAAVWQKGDTATLKRGEQVMATFQVK